MQIPSLISKIHGYDQGYDCTNILILRVLVIFFDMFRYFQSSENSKTIKHSHGHSESECPESATFNHSVLLCLCILVTLICSHWWSKCILFGQYPWLYFEGWSKTICLYYKILNLFYTWMKKIGIWNNFLQSWFSWSQSKKVLNFFITWQQHIFRSVFDS